MLKMLKRIDYRHYLCLGITLGFFACGALFPFAIPRLWESVVDVWYSIVAYFKYLSSVFSGGDGEITSPITVMEHSKYFELAFDFPEAWEALCELWREFWQAFYSLDNFIEFTFTMSDVALKLYTFILFGLPLFLAVFVLFDRIINTRCIADNKDTVFLKLLKRTSDVAYRPAKGFFIDFISFLKENSRWCKLWLWTWALYFNLISIVVEFVAFYLYLCISRDLAGIFVQLYKLLSDLTVMVKFVPTFIWISGALVFAYYEGKKAAYDNLDHNERKNQGYIAERGHVTIISGPPGSGKTLLGTDEALSEEVRLRNLAYEVILEADAKFSFFPWINLERDLKRAFENHEIFSIPSCRRWVFKRYKAFRRRRVPARIWDYDLHRYPTKYNNELEIQDIWQVIDDYACAYLVYIIQSSLLVSNYSIRVDSYLMDLGNFPLWNTDFFKRDPRHMEAHSRHAHILDWDMLRLGKTMLERNPNRLAFGFGIYVITEINQERKNSRKLQDLKSTSDEVNQKNDLFEPLVKLCRHAAIIANRVFVKFIADLQRTGDLSSELLELGEVVDIADVGKFVPVVPFWSPYWILEFLSNAYLAFFKGVYHPVYRHHRSDNTALMHVLKKVRDLCSNFVVRNNNLFGTRVLKLEVQSGKMDGEKLERKYYEAKKKIFSRRFATDAHAGIFIARAKYNKVGLNDIREYVTERASEDELLMQHSFMQLDWHKNLAA